MFMGQLIRGGLPAIRDTNLKTKLGILFETMNSCRCDENICAQLGNHRIGGFFCSYGRLFGNSNRCLHISRLNFGGILSGDNLILGGSPQFVSGRLEGISEKPNCASSDGCNQRAIAIQKFNRLPSRVEEYIILAQFLAFSLSSHISAYAGVRPNANAYATTNTMLQSNVATTCRFAGLNIP